MVSWAQEVLCMANVFDYLDWRGDLTLDLVPLCDVDAVVLSRLERS